MKRLLTLVALVPSLVFGAVKANAQTAFTYKGVLLINGSPVTGTYDFQFSLYTAASGGSSAGAINKLNVAVSSGNYTVTLDFGGSTWSSPPLYLQVAYRKSGTSTWSQISGRSAHSIRFSLVSLNTMGLQGKPVSSSAPSNGQALKWNGSAWAPGADNNTTYTAGAGLALSAGVFSIAPLGVTAAMLASNAVTNAKIANGAITPGKLAWPFSYPGSSANTLFSITNTGSGYAISGTGGQAGTVGVSDGGFGVLGSSKNNHAVHGESSYSVGVYGSSTGGTGVYGVSSGDFGVRGDSASSWGVYGTSTNNVGVWGFSPGVIGVHGRSTDGNGVSGYSVNGYGVVGSSDNSYAGYFYGTLSATNKQFRIDHPLDPTNKYLVHSCVESDEMKNVYDGTVTLDPAGEAWISLPEWFQALNTNFRYQLTAVGAPGPNLYIAREVADNRFQIAGGLPGMKVSWQVTGVRKDAYAAAHPLRVEQLKPDNERGTLLHPAEHEAPENMRAFREPAPTQPKRK